jgi:hypothetical protein
MDDARTTPRWLRIPVLLVVGGLAAYFATCFTYALGDSMPRWVWAGNWQMFTLKDPGHSTMIAEALGEDGEWAPIDLAALFPTQWDSGPRFGTSPFRRNATWMKTLAAATCGRHPASPGAVRFTELRWNKRIGRMDQSPKKAKEKALLTWDCANGVRLPDAMVRL